jgi:LCP family protein required for cell wall assembly
MQHQVPTPPQVGAFPWSGQNSLGGNRETDFTPRPLSQHQSSIGASPLEGNSPLFSPFVSPNASYAPVPSPFVQRSISHDPVPSPCVNPSAYKKSLPPSFGDAHRPVFPGSESANGFPDDPSLQTSPFVLPFAHPSMGGGSQTPPLIPQGTPPRVPGQLPQPSQGPARKKKRRFPIWARVLVVVMTVLVAIGGGLFWYYEVNFASSVNQIAGKKATTFDKHGKKSENRSQRTGSNGDILSGNRVNILLLGSDNDGKGNDGRNGAPLTQTHIVVTIDPSTNYVGMLSIPRDMRVIIPGYGAGKMGWAFSYGYQRNASRDHYADAAGLAIATVKANFNIAIHYYAWVGLDGFMKIIDTAGGVDVEALHPMVDDVYPNDMKTNDIYGYKRLYITPGAQHMSGPEALEYVRTRHSDLGGDFGRSVRQQQILTALKSKLQSSDTISKLPEYAKDLTGYLRTDMKVAEAVQLANFARTLDATKIHKLVLSLPYAQSIGDGSGDFAPKCAVILPDLQKMFGSSAGCQSVLGNATPPMSAQDKLLVKYHSTHVSANTASGTVTSAQQMASSSTLSVPQMINDPFGIRSLMDLMCMVTFERIKV